MGKDRSKPNQTLQEGDRPYAHLEWRGEVLLLGSRCLNTASGVRADYADLLWDIRKAGQYIQQTPKKGTTADILCELKRVFRSTILVGDEKNPGYATDSDLAQLIANPNQTPSVLTVDLIAKRMGLSQSTVLTYTKRRKNSKAGISRPPRHSGPTRIT